MGSTDRSKVEYAKRGLRRKYTGSPLIAGPLELGKYYRITSYGAGDDFKNTGAASNASLEIFKATGTTPAEWHGSVLNEIKLDLLKADADTVLAAATKTVTITSGGADGASQAGQITFPKDLFGQALEELIEEFDPDYMPAPSRATGSVIQLCP